MTQQEIADLEMRIRKLGTRAGLDAMTIEGAIKRARNNTHRSASCRISNENIILAGKREMQRQLRDEMRGRT